MDYFISLFLLIIKYKIIAKVIIKLYNLINTRKYPIKEVDKMGYKKGNNMRKYILLLIIVFIFSGIAGAYLGNALINLKKDNNEDGNKIVSKDKATVMIMGVDARSDDVGRSDTLMLSTVDPDNDRVSLFSIPRDTRVKIPGYGYDKINAAYAYGGRRLTTETVEDLLNTKIDHYVSINIKGFIKIIDALGGVDINVEKRMKYEDPYDDNGGLYINLYPGMQHMDGKTAITYVRYRDEEGDIGRIRRQQKFMKAVMEKALSPSIIIKLPSIIAALYESIDTDMSVSEIISFVMTVNQAKNNEFNAQMLPGKPAYIEGVSYWLPDIKKARQMLAYDLGVTIDENIGSNIDLDDREYTESIPENTVEISEEERNIHEINQEAEDIRREKEEVNEDEDIVPQREVDDAPSDEVDVPIRDIKDNTKE